MTSAPSEKKAEFHMIWLRLHKPNCFLRFVWQSTPSCARIRAAYHAQSLCQKWLSLAPHCCTDGQVRVPSLPCNPSAIVWGFGHTTIWPAFLDAAQSVIITYREMEWRRQYFFTIVRYFTSNIRVCRYLHLKTNCCFQFRASLGVTERFQRKKLSFVPDHDLIC